LEVLGSVTKYGEIYPLSHLRPSTYSTSVSKVFPSATVIVPLAPSLSKIVAIRSPITLSPLAEIVATFVIYSFPLMGTDISLSPSTT
jgi:hypothetical protein